MVSIALATLFFFQGGSDDAHPRHPRGFYAMVLVLIPILIIALWSQSHSEERLSNIGVTPHPSIVESIGSDTEVVNGKIWSFKVDATADEVMKFYRNSNNYSDWLMVSDTDQLLILERGNDHLTVGAIAGKGNSILIINFRRNEN